MPYLLKHQGESHLHISQCCHLPLGAVFPLSLLSQLVYDIYSVLTTSHHVPFTLFWILDSFTGFLFKIVLLCFATLLVYNKGISPLGTRYEDCSLGPIVAMAFLILALWGPLVGITVLFLFGPVFVAPL